MVVEPAAGYALREKLVSVLIHVWAVVRKSFFRCERYRRVADMIRIVNRQGPRGFGSARR